MNKEKQQQNFIICSNCQGGGRICSACNQNGIGLWLDGYFLYWNKMVTKITILQNKVYRTIKFVINAFLFIVSALGVFALGLKIGRVFTPGVDLLTSWRFILDTDDFMLVFWIGMLTALYLFYRFNRDLERQEKIGKKKYKFEGQVLPITPPTNWESAWSIDKKNRIEVSGSFSSSVSLAVEKSYLLSSKLKHDYIEPLHLLSSILTSSDVGAMLARLGIPLQILQNKIVSVLSQVPAGNKKNFSLNFKKSLLEAYRFAYSQGKSRVEAGDIFYGIVKSDELSANVMYDLEADADKIKNVAQWVGFGSVIRANYKKMLKASRFKPKGDLDRAMTALATPFLDRVSRNLTTMAKYGYLFPCIGRDRELEEIFRIIESGGRRNVILVGEQGVGKTSIIEGIASRMATEDVPEVLRDKRLVSLSISSLIGGATPEVAQARLIQTLNEITLSKNIILVIEDIRELTGITIGEEQSLDLAEILAKSLVGSSIFAISTATPKDYVSYIEKNSALGGVFQKVDVPEMDQAQTILTLEAHAGNIEAKNQVYFSYAAIEKAVTLSERFIHGRQLPEKAINVLEDSAVMVKGARGAKAMVTGEDVAEIISQMSNVPVTQVGEEETDKLLHLEENIHQKVIGQDDAVRMVSAAIRRARTGLRSVKRPIANLLFLGPTGVGKTQLAKTVAEVYFGSEDKMIRLDMSEFQEAASIARLIGTSRGGDGLLTEPVRQNPFSLILLDEIEKADKNVINIFLQVMEDGRLTDGSGQVIDFTNAIIIATSNAGTEFIQERISAGEEIKDITDELIDVHLKPYYRPEFLNRLDGIMVFKPLTMDEVKQIAKLQLNEVADSLEEKGVELQVTDEALTELAQAGFNPVMGARPLRRAIQKRIRDVLATYTLENKLGRRDIVVFGANGQVEIKKPKR